jgi:hypothetical protein
MSQGERQSSRMKTLPGLGHPVSRRNHGAYHRSPLRQWEAQDARLDWFLDKLVAHEARDDLAHWFGELWATPPRPGQIEMAMAALAHMGTPQSRLALKMFQTDHPVLSIYREVCLAYWEERRSAD